MSPKTENAELADDLDRVAEWAAWMARALRDGGTPDRELRRRLEGAVAAMEESLPKTFGLNQIAALLHAASQTDMPLDAVRSGIAAILADTWHPLQGDVSRISDAALTEAIEAWRRDSTSRGGVDKWTATLALVKQAGIVENYLTRDALRRAWERRHR